MEMKTTKKQLKRLIKEFYSTDIENYLRDNAAEYHRDPSLDAKSIRMLLMDDFMDNIGHAEDIRSYQELINSLSIGDLQEGSMKITKRQLRRIIKETLLREGVDTDAHVGDHDPITVEIPALETIATEENFDGKKVWHGQYDAVGIAEILEEDEPSIEDYGYDEDKHEEALDKWNKIHGMLDGFDHDDKRELAANIRSAIKDADDQGHEY